MNSDKRSIKRLGVVVMISLLSLAVTSCGVSKYVSAIKGKVNEYEKKKRENDIQGIVMNAIIDKDVEPIYRKLCPQLKKKPGIRKQISEMIDTFDSDIVKWQRAPKEVMSKSVSEGVTEEEYDAWLLRNVETRRGTRYMVAICVFSINKKQPDTKGLFGIEVYTEAESSSEQKILYTIVGDFK
ncbi:DUF5104 domain-containing protein [Candidatus Weimeria sp. HCP3S3_B5]|uniref:DUF5104 domain-containing protein n=1 Tax=Candidatus Weimeria sp. HCP3S3_B5 TaxID=3438871 RepID=UPI003F886C77